MIFVAVDQATRWMWAAAYPSGTSANAADFFVKHIRNVAGTPKVVVTDNGSEFTGPAFEQVMNANGVNHILTPVRHPQSNAHAERGIGSLSAVIRKMCNVGGTDWDEKVADAACYLNQAVHDVTGFTPWFLVYGREARTTHFLPVDRGETVHPSADCLPVDRARAAAMDLARKRTEKHQAKSKARYDEGRRMDTSAFTPGCLVTVKAPLEQPNLSARLAPRRRGPHTIVGKESDIVFWVEKANGDRFKSHVQMLRPVQLRPSRLSHPAAPAAKRPESRSGRRRKRKQTQGIREEGPRVPRDKAPSLAARDDGRRVSRSCWRRAKLLAARAVIARTFNDEDHSRSLSSNTAAQQQPTPSVNGHHASI